MIKKYFIVGYMWWCTPVVGEGTREAEVVGSNSSKARKNSMRAYSRKYLFLLQIFILARKRMMPVTYVLT